MAASPNSVQCDGDSKAAVAIRQELGLQDGDPVAASDLKKLTQAQRTRGFAALNYFVKNFPSSEIAKAKQEKLESTQDLLARYITDAGMGKLGMKAKTVIEKNKAAHGDSRWYHTSEIAVIVGCPQLAEDICDDCESQVSTVKKAAARGLKQYYWSRMS